MLTVRGSTLSEQARTVIQDKTSIAYLGEVVPGSSAASLGITNALDILQVSPDRHRARADRDHARGRERARRVLRVAWHVRADVRAGGTDERRRGQGANPGDAEPGGQASCTSPRTAVTTGVRSRTRSVMTSGAGSHSSPARMPRTACSMARPRRPSPLASSTGSPARTRRRSCSAPRRSTPHRLSRRCWRGCRTSTSRCPAS